MMGIEDLLANPEKVGIISLLMIAVASLVRGWVMPGVTHDRIVTQLTAAHLSAVTQINASHASAVEDLEREAAFWRQIAFRGVTLAETGALTAADVIKKAKDPA